MSVHRRRPVIYMPHWDVRLACLFNKRNFPVVGLCSVPHDVVCFVDGPPVLPLYYGEVKLDHLKCDIRRDRADQKVLRQLRTRKPKIGIGRGAHLLNIFNGGSAWQLVTNHVGVHKTTDMVTGDVRFFSSNHEQLMLPSDKADVLMVTDVAQKFRCDGFECIRSEIRDPIDAEAIYYQQTNSFCFQPPLGDGHTATEEWFFNNLHEWLMLEDTNKSLEP